MVKYKRVNGKTYYRLNGAPALWYSPQERNKSKNVPRTYSNMQLEAKRKKRK